MKDKFLEYAGYIPFFLIVNGNIKLNWTRIVEGLVIAIITGVLASALTVRDLSIKYDYLKETVIKADDQLDKRVARLEDCFIKLSERELRR